MIINIIVAFLFFFGLLIVGLVQATKPSP